MTHWDQIRNYLHEHLDVDEDDHDCLWITHEVRTPPRTRLQRVLIARAQRESSEWITMSTAIGEINPTADPARMLQKNAELLFGGLSLVGNTILFGYSLPVEHLDLRTLTEVIRTVGTVGDALERELTDADVF